MATEIPNALVYQIGRHILDGASLEWVASRTSLSPDDVETAWITCLERLAPVLGIASDNPEQIARLIRDDPEPSLRLLLNWQEDQALVDYAASLAPPGDQVELPLDEEE